MNNSTHVDFIRDTQSIIAMLQREVPYQIKMSALQAASTELIYSEAVQRKNIEKAITHFEKKIKDNPNDEQAKATVERLKREIEQEAYKNATKHENIDFSSNTIRQRLHVIFGAYLAYLEEKDKEGFKQALDIIEKGISNRKRILAKVKRELRMTLESNNEKSKKEEDIEKAVIKSVAKFLQPVDKVSQEIFKKGENEDFYNGGIVDLVVSGKDTKREITTAVSINIDNFDDVKMSNDVMLDPYNRAVHNALVSIYEAGNEHATINQIYRVMNGNRETLKAPEEETKKAIMESVEKLRHSEITIDLSNEAKIYNFKKLKIKDFIIPAMIVTAEVNGQVIDCIKFRGEPPLATYSKQKKQINTCDIKMLDIPLNNSKENIIIKNYLLERVQGIINKKSRLNNVILYETLYKYLGLDENEKTIRIKRQRVRQKVHIILEAWIKAGYIKGFEDFREGNTVTNFRVYVN